MKLDISGLNEQSYSLDEGCILYDFYMLTIGPYISSLSLEFLLCNSLFNPFEGNTLYIVHTN